MSMSIDCDNISPSGHPTNYNSVEEMSEDGGTGGSIGVSPLQTQGSGAEYVIPADLIPNRANAEREIVLVPNWNQFDTSHVTLTPSPPSRSNIINDVWWGSPVPLSPSEFCQGQCDFLERIHSEEDSQVSGSVADNLETMEMDGQGQSQMEEETRGQGLTPNPGAEITRVPASGTLVNQSDEPPVRRSTRNVKEKMNKLANNDVQVIQEKRKKPSSKMKTAKQSSTVTFNKWQESIEYQLDDHTPGQPFFFGRIRYKCEACPKEFKFQSTLHYHYKFHWGDKPFCCPLCGKSFAVAHYVKKHVKTKHADEAHHVCQSCQMEIDNISDEAQLRAHIIPHAGKDIPVPVPANENSSQKLPEVNIVRASASSLKNLNPPAEVVKLPHEETVSSKVQNLPRSAVPPPSEDGGRSRLTSCICTLCGKGFQLEDELKEHKVLTHSSCNSAPAPPGGRQRPNILRKRKMNDEFPVIQSTDDIIESFLYESPVSSSVESVARLEDNGNLAEQYNAIMQDDMDMSNQLEYSESALSDNFPRHDENVALDTAAGVDKENKAESSGEKLPIICTHVREEDVVLEIPLPQLIEVLSHFVKIGSGMNLDV